jgi:hypothetical protein
VEASTLPSIPTHHQVISHHVIKNTQAPPTSARHHRKLANCGRPSQVWRCITGVNQPTSFMSGIDPVSASAIPMRHRSPVMVHRVACMDPFDTCVDPSITINRPMRQNASIPTLVSTRSESLSDSVWGSWFRAYRPAIPHRPSVWITHWRLRRIERWVDCKSRISHP